MSIVARVRLDPDARRAQIVEAARALYRERNYDDVSIQELADAAGVARGLINHYFGSTRALFLAVLTQSARLPVSALPDLTGLPLPERARLTMDWILDGASDYGQEWVSAAGADGISGASDVQEVVDEADDRAARCVLDALGLRDDAALRARLRPVAAYIKALCREWLQRNTLDRETVLRAATAAVLAAVQTGTSGG